MAIKRTLIARLRRIDLRVLDAIGAVALTAAALADAASQPHRELGVPAVVALVVLTTSVAWRRRNPLVATLVAVTAFAAFQVASGYDGDGTFEVTAIALNFYMLGRRSQGRDGLRRIAFALVYWLGGAAVVAASTPHGSAGDVLGSGVVFGVLPFALGRTLSTRSALARELEITAARLQNEQELRARDAASEERSRMARELHDVIAHNVSVMVIQSSAARLVAPGDVGAAREALAVVEVAGREALVELRRIVGVLRHGDDTLADAAAPGLSQLGSLADRARAAGLPVELSVLGRSGALSPGLDLVVYRVVQEALTNAIKHAGPARAHVRVTVGASDVQLEVTDDGAALAPPNTERSGHGLIGMSERVLLYGGELSAQRSAEGGFHVRARIPLDASATALATPAPAPRPPLEADADRLRWPWLDPAIAAVALVAMEAEVLTSSHVRGPLAVNMAIVAAMALAAIWRRREPMVFLLVVGLLSSVLTGALDSLVGATVSGIYTVLLPPYAIAAWTDRRRAVIGLEIYLAGVAFHGLLVDHVTPGYFLGGAITVSAAWTAGRAIRSRRLLTAELRRRTARLAAEREDRARLAVAGERTRIARELHTVVARSVAAMVVQTQAAARRLGADAAGADQAIGAIEDTGRQALVEMRRILGVLRHADEAGERAPQPGVDAIYALIQHAREGGRPVALTVDGEPGMLPAGVDLGIYRILEDALTSTREQAGEVTVALRFGEDDLELSVTATCRGPSGWPTMVMRERVALCGGDLDPGDDERWQLVARMPRGRQGAFA